MMESLSFCLFLRGQGIAKGFLGNPVVKNLPATARDTGDMGWIPQFGICPREVDGNPLQYYCLGNSMHRGAWWLQPMRLQKSRT